MKLSAVIAICGLLLMTLAGTLILPLLVAISYDSYEEVPAFLQAILASFGIGGVCYWGFRRNRKELGGREGFAIVALGWVLLSAAGALPFWLAPNGIPSYIDAYFETMSGFSTTGASILTDIEAMPKGLLLWRSLTHWLGGMGIVVLTVAILPFLGAGGYQMLRAEVPGPTADKLKPRIAQTATILWSVYLVLTLTQIALLLPSMDLFDASCHAFGTLATGGFSTQNASLAQYDSAYVDIIVTLFMILAGANFVLHYRVMTGRGLPHFWDSEFRAYLSTIVIGTLVVTAFLYFTRFPAQQTEPTKYDSLVDCFRYAGFQVASVVTTTGYVTADFDRWPNACRVILAMLMVFGACAGSTGGGVKIIRILVLVRYGFREIHRLVRPHAVLNVRIGGQVIEREVVARVMGFMALYCVVFVLAVFAMSIILQAQPIHGAEALTFEGQNEAMTTAFSSVLATIGNIGPGFASVGPLENFSAIPRAGKLLLIFCMLVGRLEIYSVLVILVPLTWRK